MSVPICPCYEIACTMCFLNTDRAVWEACRFAGLRVHCCCSGICPVPSSRIEANSFCGSTWISSILVLVFSDRDPYYGMLGRNLNVYIKKKHLKLCLIMILTMLKRCLNASRSSRNLPSNSSSCCCRRLVWSSKIQVEQSDEVSLRSSCPCFQYKK